MKLTVPVIVGKQNRKVILSGNLTAADIISALTSEAMSVNPKAQRSLGGAGAHKETTRQLLDDERVHKTPRMKSFVSFLKRVMDELEKGHSDQGFFGALSLAVPQDFREAQLHLVGRSEGMSSPSLALFQNSLGNDRQLGVFVAEPRLGQPAIHIGDGQGRCVGFYAFDKTLGEEVSRLRKLIRKLEAKQEDATEEKRQLEEAEKVRERGRTFLSKNDVPFVLYVQDVQDGKIVGISEAAEKRMYIEGNALNTQAGKEQVIKYETWSPVVVALQQIREMDECTWMSPDYIEEDAKSIVAQSTKVFTLSALVQAHSRAMMGNEKAAMKVPDDVFDRVDERRDFVTAFWQRVTNLFGAVWVPPHLEPKDRLKYLEQRRNAEQNVLFSAVFLQALGQLGYTIGNQCEWNPDSEVLAQLDSLRKDINFFAARKAGGYDKKWTTVMMKEKTNEAGFGTGEFNFYNTRDTVKGTHALLANLAGIELTEVDDEPSTEKELPPPAPVATGGRTRQSR